MWTLVGYFVINGTIYLGSPLVIQENMTEEACSIGIEIVTDDPPKSEYPIVFYCERQS